MQDPKVNKESPKPSAEFDVFLCFRGVDTRFEFTTSLYEALRLRGVHAFMDVDGIQRGGNIDEQLLHAIRTSTMAIPIFSPSFAESTSCLRELGRIMERGDVIVVPIFYNVDPSDLRRDDGPFGTAFLKHQQDVAVGPVIAQMWRDATIRASKLAGFSLMDAYIRGNPSVLIRMVVEEVLRRLNTIKHLLLPNSELEGETALRYRNKLKALLLEPDVHKIGVWGMGGVGKTSIVSNLCNVLLNSSENPFEKIIFVKVPFEDSVRVVRNEIAIQLMIQNIEDEAGRNGVRAASFLKQRLRGKKFLLILDDLWKRVDLEEIGVPEPNRENGCKIVLTTRNRRVCHLFRTQSDLKIEPMPHEEAMEFFLQKVGSIPKDIEPLSKLIVEECGGLPLILVSAAEYLRNQSDRCFWEGAINNLRRSDSIPINQGMDDALKHLRLSYDRLENQTQKDIFLACVFYIGKSENISCKELRKYILLERIAPRAMPEGQSFYSHLQEELVELIVLQDCCMIEYSSSNEQNGTSTVHLNGVMRQMVHDMTLADTSLILNDSHLHRIEERMAANTRIQLTVRSLQLREQPFGFQNLISLSLSGSTFEAGRLPETFFRDLHSLLLLKLSRTNLHRLPESIVELGNLRLLDLSNCVRLKTIKGVGRLRSLLQLSLDGCSELRKVPLEISGLTNLRDFQLDGTTKLRKISSGAFARLRSLEMLRMAGSAYVWSRSQPAVRLSWHSPSAHLEELVRLMNRMELLTLRVETHHHFEYLRNAVEDQRRQPAAPLKIMKCCIHESNRDMEFNAAAVNNRWTSSCRAATNL